MTEICLIYKAMLSLDMGIPILLILLIIKYITYVFIAI